MQSFGRKSRTQPGCTSSTGCYGLNDDFGRFGDRCVSDRPFPGGSGMDFVAEAPVEMKHAFFGSDGMSGCVFIRHLFGD